MPIEFFDSPQGPSVRQSFDSPTVYLDHWAMRLFSDDRALQDRLVTSLLARGGTILLSHISLAEFATATDSRHCADTEAFLERVLPNVFFTDFRFDEVLIRERAEPDNSGLTNEAANSKDKHDNAIGELLLCERQRRLEILGRLGIIPWASADR